MRITKNVGGPTTSSRKNPHVCNHRSAPVTAAKRKLGDLYMHCDETEGVVDTDDTDMMSSDDDELQALTAGHEDDDFGQQCVGARSTSACGTPPSEPPTPPNDIDDPAAGTSCEPLPCSFRAAPPGGAALRADVAFHAAKVRQPPSSQRNAWANLHVLGLTPLRTPKFQGTRGGRRRGAARRGVPGA